MGEDEPLTFVIEPERVANGQLGSVKRCHSADCGSRVAYGGGVDGKRDVISDLATKSLARNVSWAPWCAGRQYCAHQNHNSVLLHLALRSLTKTANQSGFLVGHIVLWAISRPIHIAKQRDEILVGQVFNVWVLKRCLIDEPLQLVC